MSNYVTECFTHYSFKGIEMPTAEFLKFRDIHFMTKWKKHRIESVKICELVLAVSLISCMSFEK